MPELLRLMDPAQMRKNSSAGHKQRASHPQSPSPTSCTLELQIEPAGTPTLTLLHLPPEVLCRILSKLPYDQRLTAATVCRAFNEVLSRPMAWPDLLLRARGIYPTSPPLQLTYWLAPRCSFATEVTLRNFDLTSSSLLDMLTRAAHRLTALNLELVTGVQLDNTGQCTTPATPRHHPSNATPASQSGGQRDGQQELHGGGQTLSGGPLTALTALRQLGLRHVECHSFPDAVLHLSQLRSLDARPLTSGHPCVWVVPPTITTLVHLKRLALASLAHLVLPPQFAALTSLRELTLDTVRHIEGGPHLPPSLTSLNVAYCWASAPLGEAALGQLTGLQSLRVVSCGRRNLTPGWMTRLQCLREYTVEEDSHEWYINLDVLAKLPQLQVLHFEVDEFLGPAMMYCTGSPAALHTIANLPDLRALRIMRASGLSAMSYFVIQGLQGAFQQAGRVLQVDFETSRGLQHNPDGLDRESLVNRDSYLMVRYEQACTVGHAIHEHSGASGLLHACPPASMLHRV